MDATPQPPQENPEDNNDWLLSPNVPSADEVLMAPEVGVGPDPQQAEVLASSPMPIFKNRKVLTGAGFVAAGLVAGVIGGFALGGHGNDGESFTPAGNQLSQGLGSQGPGGEGRDDQGLGSFGAPGGQGGGVAGEQRLAGVLTSVGSSSITVKSVSGSTATYGVSSSTQILRNMQNATLSDLKAGDAVFVHVVPVSGNKLVAERIFAGTLPQGLLDRFGGSQQGSQQTQPGVIVHG